MPPLRKIIRVGGLSRDALLVALRENGVELNDLVRELMGHPSFAMSADATEIEIVDMSVADLGFPEGATFDQIRERGAASGLRLCPLKTADVDQRADGAPATCSG